VDEDYFSEDDEDIFKDEQIIKNLETITSQYNKNGDNNQQNHLNDNIELDNPYEKTPSNIKDHENMITSSKNMDIDNDRNMKFIDICVKNNEDEEILLLKRKKLYEENENILD
jgi:hypothetical protein